jgi:transcriptional regulator with XRE-family HTH domain
MGHREHGSVLLARYLAGPPRQSQAALATRVGKTQQTVSRWKSGEDEPTDFETQLLLEEATAYAVPVESWLSDEAAAALVGRRRKPLSSPPPPVS